MDSGYRLTAAQQCPPKYDLRRPIQAVGRAAEVVNTRRSLEDTWRVFEAEGAKLPRRPDGRPFVPDVMPNYDDEERLGFSYFRSGLEDEDLGNLTLPRTFFGRSGFIRVNFTNTDLSESRMCWNDFDDCDFSGANLSGYDMRASLFTCKFAGAVLRGADLRRSTFQECDFTGAGCPARSLARLAPVRAANLFSEEQRTVVSGGRWGPEPPGG